jgi:hypothetical protein
LRNEILSWNRHQKLEIKVKPENEDLTITALPEVQTLPPSAKTIKLLCDISRERYKNFQLVFEDENLCAFESTQQPQLAVLEIGSFVYRDSAIRSLNAEVEMF